MRRALSAPVACAALACAVVFAALLAGCGGGSTSHPSPTRTSSAQLPADGAVAHDASLVLDFTPNAVHAGIYEALQRHLDVRAGVALHVQVPGASTDAISELRGGRVDFALLDIHDLAIADARGAHLTAIMPIVQRPLASLVTGPDVSSPSQLPGRTVGVTGAPSDLAVLRSEVRGAGGDPARVHTIDIGFNAVADVVSGRVAGATAFWNDEGVTLRHRRVGGGRYHVFRVDDYGAPSYPELVLTTTAARAHSAVARDVVTALTRGYEAAVADPTQAEHALEARVRGLDPSLVSAELPGLVQAFAGPEHRVGSFDVPVLRRWARWERRFGIVRRTPNVGALFATGG